MSSQVILTNRFTLEQLEQMCREVNPFSAINIEPATDEQKRIAARELQRVKDNGWEFPDGTSKQGIKRIKYTPCSVTIEQTPVHFPGQKLAENAPETLGNMTGVFAHVYDQDNPPPMYSLHLRGKDRRFQIVAGFGEFGEHPETTAQAEVAQELWKARTPEETKKILEKKQVSGMDYLRDSSSRIFADVQPYVTREANPMILQAMFSFIYSADLTDFKNRIITNYEELGAFEEKAISEPSREAHPFLVPFEFLREITQRLSSEGRDKNPHGRFHGPVNKTIYNFLDWYNRRAQSSF